jgi:hypothetical protein
MFISQEVSTVNETNQTDNIEKIDMEIAERAYQTSKSHINGSTRN